MLDSGFVYSEKLWSLFPPPVLHCHPAPIPGTNLSPCSEGQIWWSQSVRGAVLISELLDTQNYSWYVWQCHTLCYQRIPRYFMFSSEAQAAKALDITTCGFIETIWKTKITFIIFPCISWINRHLCLFLFEFMCGTLLCGRSHTPCFYLLI